MSNNLAYFGGGASWATLNHCRLIANAGRYGGGGASHCTLNHCTLSGNRATNYGGGACWGTLNNCVLTGNAVTAQSGSGGATSAGDDGESTLNNCTLAGNSTISPYGGNTGGAHRGTLNNCILYSNTAIMASFANYAGGTLKYCCTTPLAYGPGNFTNAPVFVDYAAGNLRLQSNSPCINAGTNYALATTDRDGRPRKVGGRVDLGAYEFQPGVSGGFIGYLEQYGLPSDGSADGADADADGLNNWQEWCCLTCPTNALSALRLLEPLARRRRCAGALGEHRRGDLSPVAEHEPVRVAVLPVTGDGSAWPGRQHQLPRHQRVQPGPAVLSRGRWGVSSRPAIRRRQPWCGDMTRVHGRCN